MPTVPSRYLKALSRAAIRLHREQEGVTAVEFAFVAPILILLMVGMVETSLVMFTQNVMEGATFAASRLGKTGYVETDSTREETILATLNQRLGMLVNTDNLQITSTSYNKFDQIGEPEPFVDVNGNGERDDGENYTDVNLNGQYDEDMGSTGLGNAGQVVVYTVSYDWPVFTPLVGRFLGDGHITLTSRAVVQNEPYNDE